MNVLRTLKNTVIGKSRDPRDAALFHRLSLVAFFAWVGLDIVDQVTRIAPSITARFPSAVFFGGQLLFVNESAFSKVLHNPIVFGVQKSLHRQGIPFVILPIRV